jgi:bifunctional non-homologous end joining protein LigD
MTSFIPPQLCATADHPPRGSEWIHEVKLDGYRIQAHVLHGRAQLLTRKGHNWSDRFPEIAALLASLPDAVLDGELVALNATGIPDFAGLQAAMKEGRTAQLQFFAFDLLALRGRDLRDLSLLQRKAALRDLLKQAPAEIVYVEHIDAPGDDVFRSACQLGFEGIVSKRCHAPYTSGRGNDWIKVKRRGHDEFVIGGYTHGPQGNLSLLLGAWQAGRLVYVGRVSTGIGVQEAKYLRIRLNGLRTATCPFLSQPTGRPAWVEPRLVAEVDYAGFTRDGKLREPFFKALREDKPAEEVEMPRAAAVRPTQR